MKASRRPFPTLASWRWRTAATSRILNVRLTFALRSMTSFGRRGRGDGHCHPRGLTRTTS